jgi:hypothetical protein
MLGHQPHYPYSVGSYKCQATFFFYYYLLLFLSKVELKQGHFVYLHLLGKL